MLSFTGQLTHFSKLQHSCVLLYPFNLIAASFCLLTSLWLLSAFGVTKDSSSSSFFISPPGAIDRLFLALRGRCTLLDFKFKFQEFNDKTNSQVSNVFLMLVTGQKLLASEQIKYSAFSRTLLVLGNRTEIHQLKKIQWNNHKGKSEYYFIYLFILFIIYLFIYLFIIRFRHGLSVFL